MYMVAEEVLEPVVNVVWNAKHGVLFKYGAVAYGVHSCGVHSLSIMLIQLAK